MNKKDIKHILLRAVILMAVSAMLCISLWLGVPEGVLSGLGLCETSEVKAADDSPEGTFTFLIGNLPIKDGGTIDYSLYNTEDSTLTIVLRNTAGITAGTKFKWTVSNSNVIKLKNPDNDSYTVVLDIISPGYSGLSVTMETPDGVVYTAVAYCDIYVPLQWSDNVSKTKKIMNNLLASEENGNYGLLYAQTGDSSTSETNKSGIYTLQLYAPDSSDHPEASHYLRKLKYVKYNYKDGRVDENGVPYESVESNLEADELGTFTAALEWSTSDANIVEVDSLTGYITAKSAGFAKITVKTSTVNERVGKGDELSFDVVVVPECYVSGNTSTAIKRADTVIWKESSIAFQTNAMFANTLEWRVFRGDVISSSTDITSQLKKDIQPGDANGRMVIDNLKAGVYYVTAVPKKSKDAATETPTYDVTTAKISPLAYVIVVPLRFPPQGVTLSYYNQELYDSYDLLSNSNLPEGIFKFTTGNEQVAKVGQNNGVIDAVGEGYTEVTISVSNATSFDKQFGSYATKPDIINFDKSVDTVNTKTVGVTVYNGIAINMSSATMTLGSQLQLSLTAPSPYQGEILWSSSDASIVSVDEAGLVTANKTGDASVTVTIGKETGSIKRAKCNIKVVASVNSITLSAKNDFVAVGEKMTISAEISPKIPNASLKWTTSDPKVVAIDSTAPLSVTISGVSGGTAIITAVNPDNGIIGTKLVKVTSNIETITLSDKEVVIPKSAGIYQLYATCTPALPENEKLTWSSTDVKVVTVDQGGKVSIVKPGSATINVVTENGKMASCKFTILQGMESILLDDSSLTMFVGDTYRMTYTIKPDTTSDTNLKWSTTDSKIVSVDNTGFFTAKNTGTCVITAQAQDGSGVFTTCTVTVLRNASKITLDVTSLNLNVGESYTIAAQLNPADSTDNLYYESSNTKIATVSVTGKITAKSKGSCVIFVRTDAGASNFCNVTVLQQVTGLKVTPVSADMYVGDKLQLTATISPKNATDKEVKWETTDKKVATVDEEGLVTAVGGGATIVKCTSLDGDFMSYCFITVTEKVTKITMQEKVEIGVGKKFQLNAVVSGDKATNKNVKWASSNKKICKVSKKGVIKGVKTGTCTIRVKAADGSGVYADCEVRVVAYTESMELSATIVKLIQGQTAKIKLTTTPKKVSFTPTWSSDNEKVAIVSKKGKITAIKPGECIVKCTSGDNPDVFAICYVYVEEPPEPPKEPEPVNIQSFNFSDESMVLVTGDIANIQYAITPTNYTEGYKWSSDNPTVCSVDSNGKVTAKSIGTAKVTALSDSGKKGTMVVHVIGLSKTKITLHQYESTKISLQLNGVTAGELDVKWDTDNQDIADIANGKVTGRATGKTTVYAIVNGTHYLACTVVVNKN